MFNQNKFPKLKISHYILSNRVRNLSLIFCLIALCAFIFSNPFTNAANQKLQNQADGKDVKLKIVPEALSIIAGQSAVVRIDIERNGFEEPIEIFAGDLPEGVTIEFEDNPTDGDFVNVRFYTNLEDIDLDALMTFRTKYSDFKYKVRLFVNCDIEWVQQFGSGQTDARHYDYDRGHDVTVSNNKDIFVVGNTKGTVDPGNPNPSLNVDVWLAKYSNAGYQQWIRQLGSIGEERVSEVVTDGLGNIFIGGSTNEVMPGDGNQHRGNTDYWIAKYDSAGTRQWIKQGGTPRQDGKFGLVIIPDEMGGANLFTIVNERTEGRIEKYASNGNVSNLGRFSIPPVLRNTPYDLAVGPNNEIFVVGIYTNTTSSPARMGEYIIKYDSSGNELWSDLRPIHRTFDRRAIRVVADSAGDIYVTGQNFEEQINPLTGQLIVLQSDAWTAKYEGGNGNKIWEKTEASPDLDYIRAIGISSSGDVITSGKTNGVLGERNGDSPGREDAWVARRDGNSGDLIAVKQFPVSDIDSFEALAFDSNNGIILSGYSVAWKNNIGFEDALLMRYDDSASRYGFRLRISNIAPLTGKAGDPIKISGGVFAGVTSVRFNGVAASFTVNSLGNEITAVVPVGATSGLITVTQNCNTKSFPSQFTVNP